MTSSLSSLVDRQHITSQNETQVPVYAGSFAQARGGGCLSKTVYLGKIAQSTWFHYGNHGKEVLTEDTHLTINHSRTWPCWSFHLIFDTCLKPVNASIHSPQHASLHQATHDNARVKTWTRHFAIWSVIKDRFNIMMFVIYGYNLATSQNATDECYQSCQNDLDIMNRPTNKSTI